LNIYHFNLIKIDYFSLYCIFIDIINICMYHILGFSDDSNDSNDSNESDDNNSMIDKDSIESHSESSYDSDKCQNSENLLKAEIIERINILNKRFDFTTKITKYCKYQDNNFKIKCDLCNKIDCCTICHNKATGHMIESILNIICINCNTEQEFRYTCICCEENLKTKYSCKICNIYDNSNKYIDYKHCIKCNSCHKSQYEYCKVCNLCFEYDHKCVDKNAICPICLEDIKSKKYICMICNHFIHKDCYNKLIENTYKCPMCYKTIKDMTNEYSIIEQKILESKLIDNLDTHIKEIYCNDCEKKSYSDYSRFGIKCNLCNSYNTRLL